MLAPIGGTVYIGREDIRLIKPNDLAQQMAVVLTEQLNVNMTSAYEIVSMGRIPYTGFFGRLNADDHRVVRECMQIVNATELAERDFSSLSDGEKQKILIARALAQQPKLIILDEPTSHLDIKHKIEILRILNRLSTVNGVTVILALHDVDIAVKNCQFVLLIKDGKVVSQGRPEDIIGEGTICDLYSIEGAVFNSVMGSLELCNEKAPEVFVASGAGTGTPVFRLLSRMGYGIATGILFKNDIDCFIAETMKLTVISEQSFEPVSEASRAAAETCLRKAAFVIDTNFPVGTYNRCNIEMLRLASGLKPVLSMRSQEEIERLYGKESKVIRVSSAGQLQERITALDI
jgi:iron complex transport system ATP-binding protein